MSRSGWGVHAASPEEPSTNSGCSGNGGETEGESGTVFSADCDA